MRVALRALPKSICRYVTLNALRPRHLSRPLACVFAGEMACGCFELNTSEFHCYSANGALPWRGSALLILHVYGHQCAVMQTLGQLFDHHIVNTSRDCCVLMGKKWVLKRLAYYWGQRQRPNLVFYSVSCWRKMKCNLYTENWPLSSGRLFYSNYDIETTLAWVCRWHKDTVEKT